MAAGSIRDDREVQRRLLEIGFLAAGMGRLEEAEVIFGCLRELRPESEFPSIGLALTYLNAGRSDDAIHRLEREALAIQPESLTASAYLGLALQLAGRNEESRRILRRVVREGREPEATALAAALLNPNSAPSDGGAPQALDYLVISQTKGIER